MNEVKQTLIKYCLISSELSVCLTSAVCVQARAAVLTASQCATYDEVKQTLIKFTGAGDNFGTHLASSMITGLVTTTATAPVDVIKTHMFVGKPEPDVVLKSFLYTQTHLIKLLDLICDALLQSEIAQSCIIMSESCVINVMHILSSGRRQLQASKQCMSALCSVCHKGCS